MKKWSINLNFFNLSQLQKKNHKNLLNVHVNLELFKLYDSIRICDESIECIYMSKQNQPLNNPSNYLFMIK